MTNPADICYNAAITKVVLVTNINFSGGVAVDVSEDRMPRYLSNEYQRQIEGLKEELDKADVKISRRNKAIGTLVIGLVLVGIAAGWAIHTGVLAPNFSKGNLALEVNRAKAGLDNVKAGLEKVGEKAGSALITKKVDAGSEHGKTSSAVSAEDKKTAGGNQLSDQSTCAYMFLFASIIPGIVALFFIGRFFNKSDRSDLHCFILQTVLTILFIGIFWVLTIAPEETQEPPAVPPANQIEIKVTDPVSAPAPIQPAVPPAVSPKLKGEFF